MRSIRPTGPHAALKYALVQIPAAMLVLLGMLLLQHWLEFPEWMVWLVLALWIVKDILFFPVVRHAYAPDETPPGGSLVDARGTTRERLDPVGYVLVRGELWRAELPPGAPPVEPGTEVRILALSGLTLLVEPVETGRAGADDQADGPALGQ